MYRNNKNKLFTIFHSVQFKNSYQNEKKVEEIT